MKKLMLAILVLTLSKGVFADYSEIKKGIQEYDCLARVLSKGSTSKTSLLNQNIKANSTPRAKRKLIDQLIEKKFELVHAYCELSDKNLLNMDFRKNKAVL